MANIKDIRCKNCIANKFACILIPQHHKSWHETLLRPGRYCTLLLQSAAHRTIILRVALFQLYSHCWPVQKRAQVMNSKLWICSAVLLPSVLYFLTHQRSTCTRANKYGRRASLSQKRNNVLRLGFCSSKTRISPSNGMQCNEQNKKLQ